MRTTRMLGAALIRIALSVAPAAWAEVVIWEVNGHCYQAILIEGGITWRRARDLASEYGGHLATIGSVEENTFGYSLMSDIQAFWFVDGAGNTEGPYLGGF